MIEPTPRTDVEEINTIIDVDGLPRRCAGRFVPITFARTLERELDSLRRNIDTINSISSGILAANETWKKRAKEAKRQLDEARDALEYLELSTRVDGQWADHAVCAFVQVALTKLKETA